MYYAHSRNSRGQRHDLITHLRTVAELAARFAANFDAQDIARFLGLWHDVGKFNPRFQEYLLACEADPNARGHGPDHKAAGTQLALKYLALAGLLIQGHHGGLRAPTGLQTWLADKGSDPAVGEAIQLAQQAVADLEPVGTLLLPKHILNDASAAEFYLRMLFSALVDADYLDTEGHFTPQKALQRGANVTIAELWQRLETAQQRLSGHKCDVVSRVRHEIYQACIASAEFPPGLFRLTVPTGGGKTRSAMAFALRHALHHGQRRVIVAVPFISITEQTADGYREIFEPAAVRDAGRVVLEHHSAAADVAARGSESDGYGDFHPKSIWRRLAAENWDAPIIVTTTVQLFESLFASGTSPSRKNHRLARSVIILDEAQALPPHLLSPILDGLRQLCAHYGATVVISTATQPAFDEIPIFASLPATEIVPEPARFFTALERVRYEWRTDQALDWPDVARLMRDEPSALAVLNTKKDALALLDALGDSLALHLSTLLCGAHRRVVIAEVRRRLAAGEPCRLVSTQVIEAGVDLDFPLVLRALGPLDSIIQAAGRCNREGHLGRGRVIVFRPATGGIPPGTYRTATGITGALLGSGNVDPNSPAVSRAYFQRLFQTVETDPRTIQKLRTAFDYPEVAHRFRMIEDDTESVIVPYGIDDQQRMVQDARDRLLHGAPDARLLLRRIQPYLVSVRTKEAERYRREGLISPIQPGLGEWHGKYDAIRGLLGTDPDPDVFVV